MRTTAQRSRRVLSGAAEAIDRLELRALADEYAAAADAHDNELFASLFTPGGRFLAYQGDEPEPLRDARGRKALLRVMDNLDAFQGTLHVMANQRILELEASRAKGEVYGLAHHLVPAEDGQPAQDLVMHIRYDDVYARQAGRWHFAQRTLRITWLEQRPVLAEILA